MKEDDFEVGNDFGEAAFGRCGLPLHEEPGAATREVRQEFLPLSDEDFGQLKAEMFGAGIEHFWKVRVAVMEKIEQLFDETEEEFVERETRVLGKDEAMLRLRLRAEEEARLRELVDAAHPVWRQLSGITAQNEKWMNPNERAARIRRMMSGVERLLRHEINHAAEMDAGDGAAEYCGAWQKRSLQWDPLRALCFQYEIAQSRLSAFSKELTGLSAVELCHVIRAENVRAKMKADLREFIQRRDAESPHPRLLSNKGRVGNGGGLADEIFAGLRMARRSPRFHRAEWAAGFGFSSYQKFFRACLICYGKTPHQLEIEIIEEILGEENSYGKGNSNGEHEDREEERQGHEERRDDEEIVKRE